MRRKIILHGSLRKLYPHEIIVDTETVAEAIKAMCTVTRGVFNPKPGNSRYAIQVAGYDTSDALYATSFDEEIHIYPQFSGGKDGFFQIIIGAALVGVSFALGGPIGTALLGMGLSLALGGVMSLMSPAPQMDTGTQEQDPEASRYLAATGNTVKIGTRIPILYGEHLVFGHILSFNVNAFDRMASDEALAEAAADDDSDTSPTTISITTDGTTWSGYYDAGGAPIPTVYRDEDGDPSDWYYLDEGGDRVYVFNAFDSFGNRVYP